MKKSVTLDRNNTSFILQLFEYFKNAKWDTKYDFLKYYQNLARIFVTDVNIDSRGLLVYHTMGLGKSILAIAIAMDLIKERQPIILLTKSLQDNMRNSIKKYVKLRSITEPNYPLGAMNDHDLDLWINKNYSFVSMNASNMLKQMGKATEGRSSEEFDAAMENKLGEVLKLASLDGKLLMVDEAHNLFRAITNGSKNAIGLYDMVMKAKNLKVIFFTGTPISNDPFELVPCFNMIGSRHGIPILPESYKEFNKLFVDSQNGRIKNKEKFQNRLLGLVSYVTHTSSPGKAYGVIDPATKAEFPEEYPIKVIRVNMDTDQYIMYQLARDKEKEEGSGSKFGGPGRSSEPPALTKPKSKAASTYRVKSRQLSNFCPPPSMREEKDPNKIPPQNLGSAKFRAIYANIEHHKNQLGLVYSQFTGIGGLGTFARYLMSLGWKEYSVSNKNNSAVFNNEVEANSESTTESTTESTEESTNIVKNTFNTPEKSKIGEYEKHTMDSSTPSRAFDNIYGSGVPSAEVFIKNLELEASKSTAWWSHKIEDNHNDGSYFRDDDYSEYINDYYNDEYTGSGKVVLLNEDFILGDALVETDESKNIEFHYASTDDIEKIRELNKSYSPQITYPRYTLLILENSIIVGYFIVEFTKEINGCSGLIVDEYVKNISPEISRDALRKIIKDVMKCGADANFKKSIWGGRVDPSGAKPSLVPDRILRFAIISGEVPSDERTALQNVFNQEDNKHGGIIDLLLVSSTGAEGLDLKNIRHIHSMEPYWNWSRILQIDARGARNDSHISLPPEEKNVTPYIYLAIPPESEKLPNGEYPPTTDTELYDESILGQVTVESFNESLREISIECMANGETYCKTCNPSDTKLYTDDIARDVRASDPCTSVKETTVRATEILVNGSSYYYIPDTSSIYDYKIFIKDANINGYRQMKETDPIFVKIIDAINEQSNGQSAKKSKSGEQSNHNEELNPDEQSEKGEQSEKK